jgi:hypothetical protein
MSAQVFQQFDAETFLAKRLKDHGMAVFIGATNPMIRKDRFRKAIVAARLDAVIVGKNTAGKTETYAQLFERIYSEKLNT